MNVGAHTIRSGSGYPFSLLEVRELSKYIKMFHVPASWRFKRQLLLSIEPLESLELDQGAKTRLRALMRIFYL